MRRPGPRARTCRGSATFLTSYSGPAIGPAGRVARDGEPRPLATAIELAGYRVVQESLTNTIRYAPGAAATVCLAYRADGIMVEWWMTGLAHYHEAVPAGQGGGTGLAGLSERTRLLDGRLEAGAGPGRFRGARIPARPVTIRVLVADDQPVVRAGVATMLGTQPDMNVVGDAANGMEAVAKAALLHPDVVMMDVRMPQLNGIDATRRVVALAPPPPRVVLLTTFDLDEYVFDGLLAGASGFLVKHAPPEEILLAVRAAAVGDALVSPAPMRRLVEHFVRGRPRAVPDLDRLTDREREVLVLVVRGLSNAAIARHLVIGETTVKTHVTRILAKLALRDRAHAVIYAYETGLVRPGDAAGP